MLNFPIEQLLKDRKMNKAQLIRATGVSRETINGIINGKSNYNVTTLQKLAVALGQDLVITSQPVSQLAS